MVVKLNRDELVKAFNYDKDTGLFTHLRKAKGIKQYHIAGTKRKDGYIFIGFNGKQHCAHRLAWIYIYGTDIVGVIDHINGNTSDNRIENLRCVTPSENNQNIAKCRSHNKLGVLGVRYHPIGKKYQATIIVNGKQKSLGLYNSAEEAHKVYLSAKDLYHPSHRILR